MSLSPRPLTSALAARAGPFRHRPFVVYWAGGFVSNLGTWLQAVSASVFVYQVSGSTLAVGLLNFAGFLPILLFSIAGGVISDRYDRRHIVVVTHVMSGLIAAVLAALAFLGIATAPEVVVVAFSLNTAYAIAKPSLISLIPDLVPRDELTEAVGLNTTQFILGQMAGPLLATAILLVAGVAWAFAINALTFLGPIAAMLYLERRGIGGGLVAAKARGAAAATGAVTYVSEHRWVLALLGGVVAVSAPLEILRTLSPALVSEGLHLPESTAGLIVAAQSAGSALALVVFVPLRRRGWSRQIAAVGFGTQALGLLGAALASSLPVACLAVGLVGFGFSLCFPVLTGTIQEEVPDAIRGRIMSFHQMAHLGNRPLFALAAGTLAAAVGAQPAILAGVVLAPIGLAASRSAWRRLGPIAPRKDAATLPIERELSGGAG